MSYDTMVERNVWWLGGHKLETDAADPTLVEQVEHTIREHLADNGLDRVTADNGAQDLRVEVTVKLVPVKQCDNCKGTGSIGIVTRLGGGDEDVLCPVCKGEGRL